MADGISPTEGRTVFMSRFFFTRMAISREKKGEILERLKGIVERAVTVVFVNFHGLRSQDTSLLRWKAFHRRLTERWALPTAMTRLLRHGRWASLLNRAKIRSVSSAAFLRVLTAMRCRCLRLQTFPGERFCTADSPILCNRRSLAW